MQAEDLNVNVTYEALNADGSVSAFAFIPVQANPVQSLMTLLTNVVEAIRIILEFQSFTCLILLTESGCQMTFFRCQRYSQTAGVVELASLNAQHF